MVECNSTPADAETKPGHLTTKESDTLEPNENDVLCGRGGSINSWKGEFD
jgi:hypothetical protein